jgi:hypothetical protein
MSGGTAKSGCLYLANAAENAIVPSRDVAMKLAKPICSRRGMKQNAEIAAR